MAPPTEPPPPYSLTLGDGVKNSLTQVFHLSIIIITTVIPYGVFFILALIATLFVGYYSMKATGRILKRDVLGNIGFPLAAIAIWMSHVMLFMFTLTSAADKAQRKDIDMAMWVQYLAVTMITNSSVIIVICGTGIACVWTLRALEYVTRNRRGDGGTEDEKARATE